MIFSYLFLFCAIFATALGQLFYKKYQITKNFKFYILSIGLFLSIPMFNFLALIQIKVDIVYMFTALTIFLVVLMSKVFLNEKISKQRYCGIILIILGVLIYGL